LGEKNFNKKNSYVKINDLDFDPENQLDQQKPKKNEDSIVGPISLIPKPSYPFSSSLTLVRGSAFQIKGNQRTPVGDAKVVLEVFDNDTNKTIQSINQRTDNKGDFVVYLNKVQKIVEDIHTDAPMKITKSFINLKKGLTFKLKIIKDELMWEKENLKLQESFVNVIKGIKMKRRLDQNA